VFDGHGGSACSDFLRDHLHRYIIEDPSFPDNIPQAIHRGFMRADEEFIRQASARLTDIEVSGSCAVILLVVDGKAYIGNAGDSRAVMSANFGEKVQTLSNDHKPNYLPEKNRVEMGGGSVYK
jgi:protein phosphatase PTC2/3